MALRTPILAAALFTSVVALGLSHSTGHAAPANPGPMPTAARQHPAESLPNNHGRPESTIKSDSACDIPACPPTKPAEPLMQPPHPPPPHPESSGITIPQPIPWNLN